MRKSTFSKPYRTEKEFYKIYRTKRQENGKKWERKQGSPNNTVLTIPSPICTYLTPNHTELATICTHLSPIHTVLSTKRTELLAKSGKNRYTDYQNGIGGSKDAQI